MEDIKIGGFQGFKYPAIAEFFTLKDFLKPVIYTKRSIFLEKDIQKVKHIFCCPRCNKEADHEQGHGDAYQCGKCGLKRQSFGNGLYIWDDKKRPKVTNTSDIDYFKHKLKIEISIALSTQNYELVSEFNDIFNNAIKNIPK